jgi:hypothetical protein
MVSVMSRMIIRKSRERMLAANAAYDRVQARDAGEAVFMPHSNHRPAGVV